MHDAVNNKDHAIVAAVLQKNPKLSQATIRRLELGGVEEPLIQFFDYDDAPWAIKGLLGEAFLSMATTIIRQCPRNPERTVALRKLLEARECAMRAAVMK